MNEKQQVTVNDEAIATSLVNLTIVPSEYHLQTQKKLNDIDNNTIFDCDAFTVNVATLLNNAINNKSLFVDIDAIRNSMDDTKPFNITRWIPNEYKVIIAGIGLVSPLTVINSDKTTQSNDPVEYYIVGVSNKEDNWLFGKRLPDFRLDKQTHRIINDDMTIHSLTAIKKTMNSLKREIREGSAMTDKVPYMIVVVDNVAALNCFTY